MASARQRADAVDRSLRSVGAHLDDATHETMSTRLGHDLGRVRIHTGPDAEAAAAAVDARAFTAGRHIVFARGAYDPSSGLGRGLLAHELMHVVQQRFAPTTSASGLDVDPDRGAEREALHVGNRAGGRAGGTAAGPTIVRPGALQRSPADENPPPPLPPPAPRVVLIDGNVLDEINRGNASLAGALLNVRASGAEVYIAHQSRWELCDPFQNPDPKMRAVYAAMLDDLGITVAPPKYRGTIASRVETYSRNLLTGTFQSKKRRGAAQDDPGYPGDVLVASQAAAGSVELWSPDRVYRKNPGGARATAKGLNIAPETTAYPPTGASNWDYAVGRKLLGLPPITVAEDGTVSRTSRGGSGPAGSGSGGPAPAHGAPDTAKATSATPPAPPGRGGTVVGPADDDVAPRSSIRPQGSVSDTAKLTAGVAQKRERVVDVDDETRWTSTSTRSGSVTFDPSTGQVGAGAEYSTSSGAEGATSSVGVSGSGFVDLGSGGAVEGGGFTVGGEQGGRTVEIGGGVLVRAEKPRFAPDGRFVVSWTRDYSGSAGAGRKGARGGASATVALRQSNTGSRSFDSESDAQAFYDGGAWADLDPADAEQLGAGDVVARANGAEVKVGASGNVLGVTVGGSVAIGGGHAVEVTALGGGQISVRVTDSEVLGGAVSVGAPGVSLSFGGERTSSAGYIVTFDLGAPEGKRAFRFLLEAGRLGPTGSGYTIRAAVRGEERKSSRGIGMLGATAGRTSTTSETETRYTSGRTVEERSGSESLSAGLWGLGSFSDTDTLTVTEDSDLRERTYKVTSTVSSTSTEAVNRELAQSTGTFYDVPRTQPSDQESRRWTVSTSLTHGQLVELVEHIRRGHWNHHALIYKAGHGADFRDEVLAAGDDWDRIDRALTTFVSETGDKGLGLIRDTLGLTPRYDLVLEGDRYLTGEAGHRSLADQRRTWGRQLDAGSSPPEVVGRAIAAELTRQRERLLAIGDPYQYPDLPHELRRREVTRTESEIADLSELLGRARSKRAYEAEGEEATSRPGTPVPVASDSSQMTDTQLVAQGWEQVRAAEAGMDRALNACVEAGNEARRAKWIHDGAYASVDTAYRTWGEEHWYGDGAHVADYRNARKSLDLGNLWWKAANATYRQYRQDKANFELMAPAESAGRLQTELDTLITEAIRRFGLAKDGFDRAQRYYDVVREAHPEGRYNQWLAYTQDRPLPDSMRLR